MATVANTPRTQTFTVASASAGPFDITLRLFSTDLRVTVNDVETEDYTVTATFADGYEDDATITFDSALSVSDVVVIDPVLPPAREASYNPTEPKLTTKLNIELARIWSVLQQFARDFTRSLKLPSNATQSKEIAAPTGGNQVLASNSDNTGFQFGPATLEDVAAAQTNAAAAAASAAAAAASADEAATFDPAQYPYRVHPVVASGNAYEMEISLSSQQFYMQLTGLQLNASEYLLMEVSSNGGATWNTSNDYGWAYKFLDFNSGSGAVEETLSGDASDPHLRLSPVGLVGLSGEITISKDSTLVSYSLAVNWKLTGREPNNFNRPSTIRGGGFIEPFPPSFNRLNRIRLRASGANTNLLFSSCRASYRAST